MHVNKALFHTYAFKIFMLLYKLLTYIVCSIMKNSDDSVSILLALFFVIKLGLKISRKDWNGKSSRQSSSSCISAVRVE